MVVRRARQAGKTILPAVEASNCTHIVLDHGQHRSFATRKQKVVAVDTPSQLKDLEAGAWVLTRDDAVRRKAVAAGHKAGLFINVVDLQAEFPYCISVCERGDDFVVIDIAHATYIPYELLLAKTEGKSTMIFRNVPIKGLDGVVDDVNQSLNAFATMEHGIGVVMRTEQPEVIASLTQGLARRQDSALKLVKARRTSAAHGPGPPRLRRYHLAHERGRGHDRRFNRLGRIVRVFGNPLPAAYEPARIPCQRGRCALLHLGTGRQCDVSERDAGRRRGAVRGPAWQFARVITVGRAKIERRPC
jgi:3-dehydroquinate synthase class II